MDFTTNLHLMLDEEPAQISARQHPAQPETFFVDVYAPGRNRGNLCISGSAELLTDLLGHMRDVLNAAVISAAEQASQHGQAPTPAEVSPPQP